jgi:dipeptidyl aminopeptidase/acylaminoacyl peptidase
MAGVMRPGPRWWLLVLVGVTVSACSSGGGGASPPARTSAGSAPASTPSPTGSSTPTPVPLPAYAIDALRSRVRVPGAITVGEPLPGGPGYAKHAVTWSSAGSTMTGVLDVPTGPGPFPVVIVNHGYVPVGQYYVGQDSNKYADPLAGAGFVTISPNYPGYAGSGPGTPGVPPIVNQAISDMDLVSALSSLPQADPSRVAVAGHSNGGGVSEILLAADSRIKAVVLYAPVSTDMADNARKWWVARGAQGTGGLPSPDQDPTAYALMSPRGHLPPSGPPTLVMQGTRDEDIPAAWTSATVSGLQAAGIHTSFVSFDGAMHNFAGADLGRANSLAIAWLRDALQH